MNVIEVWRLCNGILAELALALVVADFSVHASLMTRRVRFIATGLSGLLVAATWGSIEQAIQGTEFGWRLPITSVALLFLVIGFLFIKNDEPRA